MDSICASRERMFSMIDTQLTLLESKKHGCPSFESKVIPNLMISNRPPVTDLSLSKVSTPSTTFKDNIINTQVTTTGHPSTPSIVKPNQASNSTPPISSGPAPGIEDPTLNSSNSTSSAVPRIANNSSRSPTETNISPKDDNTTTDGDIPLPPSTITYNPKEFIDAKSTESISIVAGRPYYPTLKVEKNDTQSVIDAVVAILFHEKDGDQLKKDITSKSKDFTVKVVTGAITNALFRVSGLSSLPSAMGFDCDSVLVRLFGGEGMIDRDIETCTFAALTDSGIAPPYYGRFENGRLEGWLEHGLTLSLPDFQVSETYQNIAAKLVNLHTGFHIPDELKEWHNEKEPGLWGQLFSWMEQAKGITRYKTESDNDCTKAFDLSILEVVMVILIFHKSFVVFLRKSFLRAALFFYILKATFEHTSARKRWVSTIL